MPAERKGGAASAGPALTRHLWTHSESKGRWLALLPLVPVSWFYGAAAFAHRQAYRLGLSSPSRLPAKVVSVGNLTAGGSGKTPTVAWLARQLHARGRRVAVLSRGVGGRSARQVNVVSDGTRVWLGPEEVGDEPVWLAHALSGVSVLAGHNRAALGLRAASVLGAEILLLDDGFQHHRVARDLDLVCIDARLGLGNRYTLPRGPLREPAAALRYADALLLTRVGQGETAEPRLPRCAQRAPVFRLRMEPVALRSLSGGGTVPLEALAGAQLGVVTAIARPDRFCRDLEQRGARIEELRAFPDHHMYRRADFAGLDSGLRWITTAKDAVKIPPEWLDGTSLEVLEEAVHEAGSPELCDWLLERLDERGETPGRGVRAGPVAEIPGNPDTSRVLA